jgi:sugar O-acyltransferase (sialic acid O-acetyltransferase NeuD family)
LKSPSIVVYGAGGHGKVVADTLLSSGKAGLIGFIDDNLDGQDEIVLGLPVLGDSVRLRSLFMERQISVALGIGCNHSRKKIAGQCRRLGISLINAIHPNAVLSPSVQLGSGIVIMAGAVLNADAVIGDGVIINTGAIVEHDVRVGEFAHLSPNSTLAGKAQVGHLAQIGMGAVILPGVAVGSNSIVGAGSVVVRNVPDQVVAFGVPSRVIHPVKS